MAQRKRDAAKKKRLREIEEARTIDASSARASLEAALVPIRAHLATRSGIDLSRAMTYLKEKWTDDLEEVKLVHD